MSQKLPVNGIKWIKKLSKLNEPSSAKDFIKNMMITTDKRRNHLASELKYHTTKYFSQNLLAIEMKKTKVKMNKPVHLRMSILDISKMNFGLIILNQSIKIKQSYVTWILTASLFILKSKMFTKTLLTMLKNGLTHQTMMRMIRDNL